jgi:hypothetical protein
MIIDGIAVTMQIKCDSGLSELILLFVIRAAERQP